MPEPAEVTADETVTTGQNDQQPVEPPMPPAPPQQRVWKMPKTPVTRKHADKAGRIALDVATNVARFLGGVARYGARVLTQSWRAIEAVPATVKLFAVAAIGMLLGVAGSIALENALGLLCTVVVIPVCAVILGALGNHWYTGLSNARPDTTDAAPTPSDLQRSVEYVDKKLAVALNSFGTEQHQRAVIALFQAKTAVELTLGTEQDTAGYDIPLPSDEQNPRPRIRVGSASKSLMRESNSLAAS